MPSHLSCRLESAGISGSRTPGPSTGKTCCSADTATGCTYRKVHAEVSRYEKDISVKKKKEMLQVNLYSRCMEQVPDYAKKFVVCGVNSYSWNYPLVQEWLVLCVGALRIRSCLSFCLYLGRIQGKSSHPGKGFVWEIRAVKGPKLSRRCSLDALQKRRTWPLLLTDVLNAFRSRSSNLCTNSTIALIQAVLLSYTVSPLKMIFIW